MAVLSEAQIKRKYFNEVGGFPSSKIIHELREYNGEEQICIACTQLNGKEVKLLFSDAISYSERDKKRIFIGGTCAYRKKGLLFCSSPFPFSIYLTFAVI